MLVEQPCASSRAAGTAWYLKSGTFAEARYFATAPPVLTHSFHPPFSAFTFFSPNAIMSSAARALVASSGQAQ